MEIKLIYKINFDQELGIREYALTEKDCRKIHQTADKDLVEMVYRVTGDDELGELGEKGAKIFQEQLLNARREMLEPAEASMRRHER